MPQARNEQPIHPFLEGTWDGLPDVEVKAPQTAPEWRAALSGVLSARASQEVALANARGVVTTARRGALTLFRVKLDPQEIAIQPDTDGPADLRLAVVLEGAFIYTSHAHRRRFDPGDVFVLSPLWDAYRLQADDAGEIAIIEAPVWWLFDGRCGPENLGWLGVQHLAVPADFFLIPVLFSAANALLGHDGVSEHIAQAQNLLGAALVHTLSAAAPVSDLTIRHQSRFARIHGHIMLNIASEDLSPKSAAQAMKISVRTLHQTCADNGVTFGSMVADMRMHYAAYLLRSGSAHISEVAFSVGFRSLSHFCRLFKIRYGVSARNYRLAALA